jgi:hypothetical protein
MGTNTMILIVVAAFAAVVLAGMLAFVAYKTRTENRRSGGQTIREQAELRLRRQEAVADELDTRAHAAQVEIDIKTAQARSLQHQATAFRSEAVTSRDQLNELRVHRVAG